MNLDLGDTRLIIAKCKEYGCLRNQAAYLLATAYHETAHTMKPIKERGGDAYFHKMYDINGSRPKVARALGNLRAGDGARFAGRGYVQTTGRTNYGRLGKAVGADLIANPSRAMEPEIAAIALVHGTMEGWWTGKRLDKYVTLQKSDFYNARRTVNGVDRASLIDGYARQYDAFLKAEGYGEEGPAVRPPVPNPKPVTRSRTAGGAGAAGLGGAAVAVKETLDIIESQKESLSAGDFVTLAIAIIVVAGALFALYARLDDGGYLPWSKPK